MLQTTIFHHVIRVLWMTLLGLGMMFSFHACYEENFTTDPQDAVTFSTDTVSFDTVLTEVSTVTRFFKVYNPHDEMIRLDKIEVTGDHADLFHINVNGFSGETISDVDILPGDSIYVFIEATIDPDQPLSISPFIIEAKIMFQYNTRASDITIVAWGQNANYIPGPGQPNRILILSCDMEDVIWDDPKPYVLYGTLLIDSCELRLPAGTRLYVHGGIANNELGIFNEGLIYTLPHGRLSVEGTPDRPVIIRDDRIEPDHDGEWAGIRLGPGSGPHRFSHMRLSNAIAGIYADSLATASMDHSIISFTGGPGWFARHADTEISNSLFYENGSNSVALTYGGRHRVTYCTMANYGNSSEALLVNNFYCSDPLCSQGAQLNGIHATVENCILMGNSTDEFWIQDASPEGQDLLDLTMQNNLVLVDELLATNLFPEFFTSICPSCFEPAAGDRVFLDVSMDLFTLDTMSIARDRGIPLPGFPDDLTGILRHVTTPDLGCYEFME